MSNIMKKIREKGIRQSVRMISVKLKKQEKTDKSHISSTRKNKIQTILDKAFDTVVIFENHFGYYNIMLQRPQHITKSLSDDKTLVLYNSYYDIDYKNHDRITEIKDNCYVLDMYYYRQFILDEIQKKDARKYLMIYSTDTVPYSRVQKYQDLGYTVLYEYVDDINPELLSPKKLDMIVERHCTLVKNNDTKVVATATALKNNILEINPDAGVRLISNGVECEKFPDDMKTEDKDYLSWLKTDSIKVGYYGALASWVDYELLKYLAEDSDIQIILIGVEHDHTLRESGILAFDNVQYFGRKPYEKLAGYANFFDVCLIPFVVNDITEATSPVKLFEYMAMGKPVVTTDLPECRKYDVVNIAKNKEQFRELIYEVMKKKENQEYVKDLKTCALHNDWKAKAQAIKEFIGGDN